MKILVCLKQILDPEIPVRDFQIDSSGLQADLTGANLVTNVFCENALEMALQLRDTESEGEITVISVGGEEVEDILRKALAMKADHAVRIDAPNPNPTDALAMARLLAAAVGHLGGFDLILLGRESGDWGLGLTGPYLAEVLGCPLVSFVDDIQRDGGQFQFRRQTDDGWERYASSPPMVVTVTNSEANLPRIPKTRDIMKSSRKPIATLNPSELGVEPSVAGIAVESLSIPESSVTCDIVDGDSLDEKVDQLAERIAEVVKGV